MVNLLVGYISDVFYLDFTLAPKCVKNFSDIFPTKKIVQSYGFRPMCPDHHQIFSGHISDTISMEIRKKTWQSASYLFPTFFSRKITKIVPLQAYWTHFGAPKKFPTFSRHFSDTLAQIPRIQSYILLFPCIGHISAK